MSAIDFIATPEPIIRRMTLSNPNIRSGKPFIFNVEKDLGEFLELKDFTPWEFGGLLDLQRIFGDNVYSFTNSTSYHQDNKNVKGCYEEHMEFVIKFMEFMKRHVEVMGEAYYIMQWLPEEKDADSVEIRDVCIDDMKYGPGVDEFHFDVSTLYHFVKK